MCVCVRACVCVCVRTIQSWNERKLHCQTFINLTVRRHTQIVGRQRGDPCVINRQLIMQTVRPAAQLSNAQETDKVAAHIIPCCMRSTTLRPATHGLLKLLQFPTHVFVRLQEGTLICNVKIKIHTSGEKNGFRFHYLHKYEMLGMIKMFHYNQGRRFDFDIVGDIKAAPTHFCFYG